MVFGLGKKGLKKYKQYVAKRLAAITPILQRAAMGDFTGRIEIPEEEDEFTELLVGLDLMRHDLKELEKAWIKTEKAKLAAERSKIDGIKKEREYIENIITLMPISLVVINPDATIRSVNQTAYQLLGYEEKELKGQPIEKMFGAVAATETIFKGAGLEELIKRGTIKDKRMIYLTKKGDKIPAAVSGRAIKNKKGKLAYIVIIAKDLQEILKLEKERGKTQRQVMAAKVRAKKRKEKFKLLKKMREDLEKEVKKRIAEITEANKKRFEFITATSHELRSPLSVLRLNLDMLLEKPDLKLTEEQMGLLREISDETDSITKILADLIEVARMEKRRESLRKEWFLLSPLIKELYNEKFKILAEKKRIKVQINCPAIWPVKIRGDKRAINKALSNLVSNAITYNKGNGRVVISVADDKEGVAITVRDNGIGISKKDLPHIFKTFYRGKKTGSQKRGGTGVGLAITKNIIEAHGGKILVESNPGDGTKFIVYLPFVS